MTNILILEGNNPDLLRQGKSDAVPFLTCLTGLDSRLVLTVACPYAATLSPELIDAADGVVFSGSGVAWAADASDAAPQREAMQAVFHAGRPVWGSCNGMQLAAVVLGGGVGASPNGDERGMAQNLTLTPEGQGHPMMVGKPPVFQSPCSHRDEVQTVPKGATLIAGNAHSPVQAMVYEEGGVDFWGVQYHPECAPRDVAGWMRGRGADFAQLATDLDLAEADEAAAARLGTTPQEMGLTTRAGELANWLAHVKARAS